MEAGMSQRMSPTCEQVRAALADLSSEVEDSGSLGNAISMEGKRRQMVKMLTLIMIPIFALLSVSLYFMADNVRNKMASDEVRESVEFSTELGQLIHLIQKERDMSVLYLSSIGPETKTFLNARYQETDEALEDLSSWPVSFDRQRRVYFTSRRHFRRHLSQHRNELNPRDTIFSEVAFYSDLIHVLMKWMYDAIRESRFGTVWKNLVAYQKVVAAKEHLGVERAIGSAYFSRGGFADMEAFHLYNQKRTLYISNMKAALLYAPYLMNDTLGEQNQISLWYLMSLGSDNSNLSSLLSHARFLIRNRIISVPSLRKATAFYDNMTLLIGEHLQLQRAIAVRILTLLDDRSVNMTAGVIISAIIITMVLSMCPLLIRTVQRLTDNIQNYALTLADKTKELNREKKRTDSLLYQMLPKPVAEQLKNKNSIEAEYFKEVTIFFSDILDFSRLIRESKPMDIVNVLNYIYTTFDKRIELYDVYKVETIGDSYMIASGLPQRNGSRHATEIANISLDLINTCSEMVVKQMPEGRLRLRIGIHTGPCVAGVVGLKLPRYCLFGDTVNTASRMETTGLPNCIHISVATQRLLKREGNYIIQKRGVIEVKGKGEMVTYFLLGRKVSVTDSEVEVPDMPNVSQTKSELCENKTAPVSLRESLPFNMAEASCSGIKNDVNSEKTTAKMSNQTVTITIDQTANSKIPLILKEDDGAEAFDGTDQGTEKDEKDVLKPPDAELTPVDAVPGPSNEQQSQYDCSPPSYIELEAELQARSNGSPPIFNLIEGYHF